MVRQLATKKKLQKRNRMMHDTDGNTRGLCPDAFIPRGNLFLGDVIDKVDTWGKIARLNCILFTINFSLLYI